MLLCLCEGFSSSSSRRRRRTRFRRMFRGLVRVLFLCCLELVLCVCV